MFRNKVVLIVGAGASSEVGFPLGGELKKRLAAALDIKFQDGVRQISGDQLIVEALRIKVGREDINPYLAAGRAIANAMPTVSSIDDFLETHATNKEIVLMGKLGIALCILHAEKKSPLHQQDNQFPLNLRPFESTWYAEFFKLLASKVSDPTDLFENLKVICFNYDRSIEHYLLSAIIRRFLIPREQAEEIVKGLIAHHPYGDCGQLPWQGPPGVPYGGTASADELVRVADGIRTFSEGAEEGYIAEIRRTIEEANNILCIGFGFGSMNMNLLSIATGEPRSRSVFATAFDIDEDEEGQLKNLLGKTFRLNHIDGARTFLRCTSAELFSRCRITFSSL
jgi:hypothetical protein